MSEELLRLARENNEMLKKLCAYVDKIESADYQMSEDMKQMAINMIADIAVDNNQRQQRLDGNNNNQYTTPPRLKWK